MRYQTSTFFLVPAVPTTSEGAEQLAQIDLSVVLAAEASELTAELVAERIAVLTAVLTLTNLGRKLLSIVLSILLTE